MPFDPVASAAFMRRIEHSRSRITDAAILARREQRKGLMREVKVVVASPDEEPVVHEAMAVFDTDELSGDAAALPAGE
jgi:hypothetical protein